MHRRGKEKPSGRRHCSGLQRDCVRQKATSKLPETILCESRIWQPPAQVGEAAWSAAWEKGVPWSSKTL